MLVIASLQTSSPLGKLTIVQSLVVPTIACAVTCKNHIDPLHEQEKSVKLRKLSSNGRHDNIYIAACGFICYTMLEDKGRCKIVLASAKQ